jgi:hypothetical protein
MSLKKFVTALTAVSLAVAPTMASAQIEAPEADRAESDDGDGGGSGIGQVLPIFVIAAIVFLIREVVKDSDSGDPPISP